MNSSRLPGKVLADIVGKSMLLRVIERVSSARRVDEVVVATTNNRADNLLAEYLKKESICAVYRGAADDVLDRFFECAKLHRAEIVVRITADDPLKDPQIIDRAIALLNKYPNLDYCSNTIKPSYPEGLDVEVMRFSTLERAHTEAKLVSEREHVTPYIWKHTGLFKVLNFELERDLSNWRWTVDRSEDLEFMRYVFEHFSDEPLVSFQRVIDWLDVNPEIRKINSGITRNEGYIKSLHMERL